MADVSPEVLQQLEDAQAQLGISANAGPAISGPPVQDAAMAAEGDNVAAAGNGTATYVLVDHYFTSTSRYIYAYAGNAWHPHLITSAEEAGLAQVAFAANQVDAWWDNANQLTLMRCWKKF